MAQIQEPSNIDVTSATTAAVADITESSENLCLLCDFGYSSFTNFQINPIDQFNLGPFAPCN